jgi:hypothetical protein
VTKTPTPPDFGIPTEGKVDEMKLKLAAAVAIGLMLGAALPAQAHHGGDIRLLRQRIARLETKVNVHANRLSTVEWDNYYQDQDLSSWKNRTQNLDMLGELDPSAIERPFLCYSGDSAVYGTFGDSARGSSWSIAGPMARIGSCWSLAPTWSLASG